MKRQVYGIRAVQESLAAHPADLAVVYVTDPVPPGALRDLVATARRAGVSLELRASAFLDALTHDGRHQGVVAIAAGDYPYADLEAVLDGPTPGLVVALDEITDPHNFGAIVRSAVALGAQGVLTLKDRASPVTATVVRASAGATEHCRIARVTNLVRTLEELRALDYRIIGLAGEAQAVLSQVDLTGPVVLVVGSEGRGLRRLVRESCDVLAKIPLAGPIASLNASVAAGVALYEVTRQRRVAMGEV